MALAPTLRSFSRRREDPPRTRMTLDLTRPQHLPGIARYETLGPVSNEAVSVHTQHVSLPRDPNGQLRGRATR
jgi:hypothetical protein